MRFRILEATLSPREIERWFDDDDEDERPLTVDCSHAIRFAIETEKPLSDDAIRWICHLAGDFLYPDGGWEIDPEEVEFDILSHSVRPNPRKPRI